MLQNQVVIVLGILVSSGMCQIPEIQVTLFSKVLFKGQHETMRIGGCTPLLPTPFHKNLGSINTHDNCVHLYRQPNCTGEFETVQPGSRGHHKMGMQHFKSTGYQIGISIQSLGLCPLTPIATFTETSGYVSWPMVDEYEEEAIVSNPMESEQVSNTIESGVRSNTPEGVSHNYTVPVIGVVGIILGLVGVIGRVWYRRRKLRFADEPHVALLL